MTAAVEARLQEIADVINKDLIPQTFKLNGWTDEEYPEIYFEDIDSETLDDYGKFFQRVGSTGLLAKDLPTVNKIRDIVGLEELPDGTDVTELLTPETSRSGDGMTEGMPNGTGKSVSENDTSISNLENT